MRFLPLQNEIGLSPLPTISARSQFPFLLQMLLRAGLAVVVLQVDEGFDELVVWLGEGHPEPRNPTFTGQYGLSEDHQL